MTRGYSITGDPDFQWIVFVLMLLYGGSFIWNLNHGGLIYAITTMATSLYGVFIAVILICIMIVKLYPVMSHYRMLIE